jgi:2,4-dienoyl-CoA reductase-like NADH-dependent reductase (Old Yellow Enzyme family)
VRGEKAWLHDAGAKIAVQSVHAGGKTDSTNAGRQPLAPSALAEIGIDAIEVSAGTPASGEINPACEKINKPEKEAYNLALARRIKEAVSCAVMVVGGFRSLRLWKKQSGTMAWITLPWPDH